MDTNIEAHSLLNMFVQNYKDYVCALLTTYAVGAHGLDLYYTCAHVVSSGTAFELQHAVSGGRLSLSAPPDESSKSRVCSRIIQYLGGSNSTARTRPYRR